MGFQKAPPSTAFRAPRVLKVGVVFFLWEGSALVVLVSCSLVQWEPPCVAGQASRGGGASYPPHLDRAGPETFRNRAR